MERVFHIFFGNFRRIIGTSFCMFVLYGLLNVDMLIRQLTKLLNWGFSVALYLIPILILFYAFKKILNIK